MALENMLSELRKRKHHGKRINESTAQRYLSVVSAVLSDAKRNEIIEKNPARMLDLPTPQRTVQRIPTRGEVEKLLDALAKEPRHYRLFYLLSMYTGCRRGELCALQWSDFTGTQNGLLLTVSRSRSSVPGKGIVEGSTKNGKSREVCLSSDLRGILLAYKRRKQMEADKQRRRLSPYLFTDEHGQLIHPDTFTKRLRKIYAAIGFPWEYHLHTLRHYFVTSLLHCGVDKQTVADLVGHADTGFLERTYCHPQQAQKEQAADSMLTMLRPDGEQILFGKNIQLRFAEAHQIHYLGISLLCVIGIPQVTACLFAICSRIPVNGKVDELYSVVFLVRFTDSENIYIGLDT